MAPPLAGKRVAVVANPAAGRGRARRVVPGVEEALAAAGASCATIWSERAGGIGDAVRRAASAGPDIIALLGGDGTLHEALPALLEAQHGTAAAAADTRSAESALAAPRSAGGSVLLLIPSGSGNDFARALALPRDSLAAARDARGWIERRVDLGRVGATPFATVAAIGFDAEVASAVLGARWRLPGTAAYVAAAVTTLARYRAQPLRLTGDFGVIEGRFLLIAIGNSASYGGGLHIVPEARIDDGALDICLVDEVSRATVLRLLPRVYSGGHVGYPFVRIVRAARVEIASGASAEHRAPAVFADGEPATHLPATIETMPGALRVLAPALASAPRA
ncbi:MAG: diacylglycerol/lipid kinase family protein [bacterium]